MACVGALWGMVMTPEQRELAEAFVELAAWEWAVRMRAVGNFGSETVQVARPVYDDKVLLNWRWDEITKPVPDLSDPLTVCAIELRCRELWGDSFTVTHAHFGCFAVYADSKGWTCNTELQRLDDPDWRARCLFDAMNAYVAPVEGGG